MKWKSHPALVRQRGPEARVLSSLIEIPLASCKDFGQVFQATLRKQFSHGLQLQAAYTYARAFTNEQVNNA